MLISTFYEAADISNNRAEVHKGPTGYYIEYYRPDGSIITTEHFPNYSIHYVEDAAENWALGIKNLNG
jgi:hypothetical protein